MAETIDVSFENIRSSLFSYNSVLCNNSNDPDDNFFNDKTEKFESPYFSSDNFKVVSDNLQGNSFSILHLNIRSLSKNIENFGNLLSQFERKFKVIVITESWCDETANGNSLLQLPEYNVLHKTRNGCKGGGISFFIHKSLHFKLISHLDEMSDVYESFSIEIINENSKNIVVTGIYRPPKGDARLFINQFQHMLSKIKNLNQKDIFIAGDFNINSFDYENNSSVKNFFNSVFENGLVPLINRATRVTRTTATCIDNILSNAYHEMDITSGVIKADISDHFPIFSILTRKN